MADKKNEDKANPARSGSKSTTSRDSGSKPLPPDSAAIIKPTQE